MASLLYAQYQPKHRVFYPDGLMTILAVLGLGGDNIVTKELEPFFKSDDDMTNFLTKMQTDGEEINQHQ
jgi:hypothetical protein